MFTSDKLAYLSALTPSALRVSRMTPWLRAAKKTRQSALSRDVSNDSWRKYFEILFEIHVRNNVLGFAVFALFNTAHSQRTQKTVGTVTELRRSYVRGYSVRSESPQHYHSGKIITERGL